MRTKSRPDRRVGSQTGPVRAWRVWGCVPEMLVLACPQCVPGRLGTLYGALTGLGLPWVDGQHTAVCIPPEVGDPFPSLGYDAAPHAVPGARCECGIRGDLDLAALLFSAAVLVRQCRIGASGGSFSGPPEVPVERVTVLEWSNGATGGRAGG